LSLASPCAAKASPQVFSALVVDFVGFFCKFCHVSMTTAIYPGTFDPITNGHLDVLARACRLFDKVIVAVASDNSSKKVTFSSDDRVRLIQRNIADFPQVSVENFSGLLVDYARKTEASVIVRGLRAVSDFEYEFQMGQMNRHLDSELETIFLMPNEKYFFTSSNLIKQVHLHGGRETHDLVPPNVLEALRQVAEQKDNQES
jgi:pantetheine-phosphate adenylyltransferase